MHTGVFSVPVFSLLLLHLFLHIFILFDDMLNNLMSQLWSKTLPSWEFVLLLLFICLVTFLNYFCEVLCCVPPLTSLLGQLGSSDGSERVNGALSLSAVLGAPCVSENFFNPLARHSCSLHLLTAQNPQASQMWGITGFSGLPDLHLALHMQWPSRSLRT